ncbi:uncharacterized protein CEXT_13691 [Caerostris extrusa]|uniref:Uncharacterized protein n=1 Tax=Caerostris extrusa TaxID=172846 RepID=A0AAV4YCP0_CAEEX|nr:uncharacterized protein CEXT_13691 [Caerostris extrusa]
MDHYTAPPPSCTFKEPDTYKGGPPDTLWRTSSSFKEKGTLSAAIAANNLSKSLPNASSDSDLSRVRQQRKSPSLSNVISESHSRQKENNSASCSSKKCTRTSFTWGRRLHRPWLSGFNILSFATKLSSLKKIFPGLIIKLY